MFGKKQVNSTTLFKNLQKEKVYQYNEVDWNGYWVNYMECYQKKLFTSHDTILLFMQ